MNLISSTNLSMTSREIADLVGKRHDNVKRTIESLISTGVIKSPQIEEIPTATKPAAVYVFTGEKGKRDSIVVVAQLSPEFTACLVDRWQELEAQVAQIAPVTAPVTALIDIPTEEEMRAAASILARADAAQHALQAELDRLARQAGTARGAAPSPAADLAAAAALPAIREIALGCELDLFGEPIPSGLRLVSGYDLSDMSGIPYNHMMSQLRRRGVYATGERFPMPSGRSRKVLSAVGRKIAVQFQSGIVRWKPSEALRFLGKPMPKDMLR